MSNHDLALEDEVPVDDGTQLYSHCYLCHSLVLQDEFCQLFTDPDFSSPAKILGGVLDIAIVPDLCHSLIICKHCNTLCSEYQSLIERMETIHDQITAAYNQTVMKLTGLTEKDIKDGLVAVEYDDNLDTEFQTFNKELMLMEDVFGVSELNSDIIQVDPSTESLQESVADLDQTSSDEVVEHSVQFISADEHGTTLLPTSSDEMVENSVHPEELTGEETLQRFILGSDETIVEVDAEDGTSIYCVYGEGIESVSEPEEQPETVTRRMLDRTDSISEQNAVAADSASLASDSGTNLIDEVISASSLLLKEVDATGTGSPAPSEADDLRPYYIKLENRYYCTLCSSDETTVTTSGIKLMAEHLKEAHNQPLDSCELCDEMFYQRTDYLEHIAQHTNEKGNIRNELLNCDLCDATFANQDALEQHRKTHSTEKNKAWNCELCDKKYTSKAFLQVHMNKHAGIRPYKCTLCTKDFSSKYALAVHLKTHYERPRTFVCNECGSAFYSRHNLVQHERTHRAERAFECGDCGKKFFTQHNLNVHKVIHSTNKAFACRQCGKKFARKAEVRDHERTHTGEKPFVCDMCDLAFAQRSNLNSHKRLTHFNDKRYKCDLCGASFKRRRLLVYHTRAMHTGERPFKCDLCPASFVYPEHFQKHKRIHTGIKPYACEVCHKTFTSQDNRNAHRYVHSDKKPYECVTCGAGFMRKTQLYTHMQEMEHLNDTIVVNQPRISANDLLEFETESLVVDGQADGEQTQEGSDDEQSQIAYMCDGEYEDGLSEIE
ncbi:zinc finger protein 585B-like isoform X1 [Anopheles moucheti]|uniref:zinc finger protein 585B-like isoform X1 n=2 Tax=Anopheles moucheti TaxID=186751 RepID=UPI0022F0DE2B|nr:zinc finger protein 585B-like isoform X1 [Anopheles moucheti]